MRGCNARACVLCCGVPCCGGPCTHHANGAPAPHFNSVCHSQPVATHNASARTRAESSLAAASSWPPTGSRIVCRATPAGRPSAQLPLLEHGEACPCSVANCVCGVLRLCGVPAAARPHTHAAPHAAGSTTRTRIGIGVVCAAAEPRHTIVVVCGALRGEVWPAPRSCAA